MKLRVLGFLLWTPILGICVWQFSVFFINQPTFKQGVIVSCALALAGVACIALAGIKQDGDV